MCPGAYEKLKARKTDEGTATSNLSQYELRELLCSNAHIFKKKSQFTKVKE